MSEAPPHRNFTSSTLLVRFPHLNGNRDLACGNLNVSGTLPKASDSFGEIVYRAGANSDFRRKVSNLDDARWPLHTGLGSDGARKFCLLGRLNGYFFIGSHFAKRKWVYHTSPELFLRIRDPGPGDGNGGFVVRVHVSGPAGSSPHAPYDLLRDRGLVWTSEPRDRIFVRVEPRNSGSNAVEFALETPDQITWRKELVITGSDKCRYRS